jgi:hypothetical protein
LVILYLESGAVLVDDAEENLGFRVQGLGLHSAILVDDDEQKHPPSSARRVHWEITPSVCAPNVSLDMTFFCGG